MVNFLFLIQRKINADVIKDYFGEKIALYFVFNSYYTRQLSYMAFIGLIIELLIDYGNAELKRGAIIFFCLMVTIWATAFIEFWKR